MRPIDIIMAVGWLDGIQIKITTHRESGNKINNRMLQGEMSTPLNGGSKREAKGAGIMCLI
jgi:hypothetical protein